LHDISLRFLGRKTIAERQTRRLAPVYNAWLDVVAQQAAMAPSGAQKALDFGPDLVPK
jgi:hypothetical protein